MKILIRLLCSLLVGWTGFATSFSINPVCTGGAGATVAISMYGGWSTVAYMSSGSYDVPSGALVRVSSCAGLLYLFDGDPSKVLHCDTCGYADPPTSKKLCFQLFNESSVSRTYKVGKWDGHNVVADSTFEVGPGGLHGETIEYTDGNAADIVWGRMETEVDGTTKFWRIAGVKASDTTYWVNESSSCNFFSIHDKSGDLPHATLTDPEIVAGGGTVDITTPATPGAGTGAQAVPGPQAPTPRVDVGSGSGTGQLTKDQFKAGIDALLGAAQDAAAQARDQQAGKGGPPGAANGPAGGWSAAQGAANAVLGASGFNASESGFATGAGNIGGGAGGVTGIGGTLSSAWNFSGHGVTVNLNPMAYGGISSAASWVHWFGVWTIVLTALLYVWTKTWEDLKDLAKVQPTLSHFTGVVGLGGVTASKIAAALIVAAIASIPVFFYGFVSGQGWLSSLATSPFTHALTGDSATGLWASRMVDLTLAFIPWDTAFLTFLTVLAWRNGSQVLWMLAMGGIKFLAF